ncbi:unnamed protein product [Protopolystoma xenopodis]|uniref:Uncharacterized protein n=1 Tax=Protopolystoma xenopodis TaxID=117903 RepID=A0A3S5ABM6_9PLAT|nr:unnamed protein product [Protopolystoma xenopodis]
MSFMSSHQDSSEDAASLLGRLSRDINIETPVKALPDPLTPLPSPGSVLGRILAAQLVSWVDIFKIMPHFTILMKYLERNQIKW